MNFIPTNALGCFIIEPQIIYDERGYFMESFNELKFQVGVGQKINFVQDNQSFSTKGVLRGLHYQSNPYADMKIVTCIRGKIFDVIVDLRKNSKTFLNFIEIELSEYNNESVLIPEGFAHGFQTLINDCELIYSHTAKYCKKYENGLRYDDPRLNINWPLKPYNISDRDLKFNYINENYVGL
jgi:dTDP-4-dehydrorhamnose 3,5-epimerase